MSKTIGAGFRPSGWRSQFPASYFAMAAVIVMLVGVGAWFSGVQSNDLHNQQLVSQLTDAQQKATRLGVQMHEQQAEIAKLNDALKTAGTEKAASKMEQNRRDIMQLQAELEYYRNRTDLEQKTLSDSQQVLSLLAKPGVRMTPLKPSAPASVAVAYVLMIRNRELTLVASNLPRLPADKEFQLWLTRKDEPDVVSAGVFSADDSDQAVLQFTNGEFLSRVGSFAVTVEPSGGSDEPTGPHIFTGEVEE